MHNEFELIRDRQFMAIAARMALRGLGTTAPNPAVGAVVVDPVANTVIARGWTMPGGRPHAEPVALERAGAAARGATMYVTLEPCSHHGRSPPCAEAIIEAGIARVVVGIEDPDPRVAGRGLARLRAAGIEVSRGVLREECHWLTLGHILRVTERRPFVQIKMALGADATVPRGGAGRPTWVTGPAARARGHLLRATSDAILIGSGTLIDDDPSLDCRLPGLAHASPVRVVLAGSKPVPHQLKVFQKGGAATWLITGPGPRDAPEVLGAPAEVVPVAAVSGRPWLPSVMEALVARGITRLLVEGGPTVWRAFDRAALVDEVIMFRARGRPGDERNRTPAQALGEYVSRTPLRLVRRTPLANDDMFEFRRTPGESGGDGPAVAN